MKILVTGSAGTLGRPLVKELRQRGHEVYGLDLFHTADPFCRRADVAEWRHLVRAVPDDVDIVYHLAAEFGRLNGQEYYEAMWRSNVIGTRNILELQTDRKFKLVFVSSSEVYGEPPSDTPLTEDAALRPRNDYALSKMVGEMMCINTAERSGNEIVRLRLFNAYGPGERYHPYRSVVCLFCYRLLHGLPIKVYKGYRRAFLYIGDLIPTMANVADRFQAGEVYNIGGIEYRSVEELAEIVLANTGASRSLLHYEDEEKHNTRSKRPDVQKAIRDLGHNPVVPLEEGVPMTLEWMRKVYGKGQEEG